MSPQLKHKLATWVDQGFISPEQAELILAHEGRNSGPERPWTLYGIAGIGVTALVTGVISLVAANWDEIAPWVKLSGYFLLQGAVGYAFYRNAEKPGLVRETLLTLFAALFLAGIGLVAQLYNLHGDGWQALLMWVAITLPAVYLAQGWALVHLWIAALLLASVLWAGASTVTGVNEFGRACVVATLPLLLIAVGLWTEHFPRFNVHLRRAALVWGIAVVMLVGTPLANVLWHAPTAEFRPHLAYLALPWAALSVAAAGAWYWPQMKRDVRLASVALLVACGAFMTLPLFFGDSSESLSIKVFAAAGFFCTWVLAAATAAFAHQKRWFDFASLAIALRVVIVYFEVFGSLAMTGVGLIVSGIVILTIAFAWHRFRERVRQQIGGAV